MANTANDVMESRRLVRMYSGDVEGRLPHGNDAHFLGQVLAYDRPDPRHVASPWRKFFDPPEVDAAEQDPVTSVITVESEKLCDKWLSFLRSCSDHDRLDLSQSEPTMEGVVELVTKIVAATEAKKEKGRRAKATKYFHKFCKTVDAHKSMLEIIPQGSEYVSMFAGTLSVIIQASVNHEHIAEGLSESLCTISECVTECGTELEMFQTMGMKQLIADLYAHIFVFLSDVMGWITEKRRKRLLDSFNENFYKKFEDQIERIRSKSDRIKNLAAQSSRAEQRVTRLAVEDIARDVRVGLVSEERRHAEVAYMAERIERELSENRKERELLREDGQNFRRLADRITTMLQDKAMVWIGDMRSTDGGYQPSFRYPTRFAVSPGRSVDAFGECSTVASWTSEEVLLNSRDLEDYFHRDRVRLRGDPLRPNSVTPDAFRRLSEWMKNQSSRFLWLEGPPTHADDFENPLTVLANCVIELAEQAHVPVISYCCELRRGERLRAGNVSREAQASVSLVFALIRQMIELLSPKFETVTDLSEARFRLLDGSILNWRGMIQVARDVLQLMPDTLLCIIDGFHWLDDRGTTGYLEELVQAMRGTKLRVLFTTTGRSGCLLKQLQVHERLGVETGDLKGAAWDLTRNNALSTASRA
ncbi:hypothetical protein F5Y19DRAFT_440740 [Xylariaceae sp. FL1651]|nr:hypothetical protein F5Y19DRAFT_440740 [Xylariaceae sp. FL1651]